VERFWILCLVTLSPVEPAVAGPAAPAVAAGSPHWRSPVSFVHTVGFVALPVAVVIALRLVDVAPVLLVGRGGQCRYSL
jgi:hypothetical protein